MDYHELEADRNKILSGLVNYYLKDGYKSPAYMDSETGGIYEHKLAHMLGYRLAEDNHPPSEFDAATRMLEEQRCVRRMRRNPNFEIMGVWPTLKGLEEIENLKAPSVTCVSDSSSVQKVGSFKKIWNDSVLSNAVYDILKWGFIPVVSFSVSYFSGWWPYIGNFFGQITVWILSKNSVPNWLLIILGVIVVLYIVQIGAFVCRFMRKETTQPSPSQRFSTIPQARHGRK